MTNRVVTSGRRSLSDERSEQRKPDSAECTCSRIEKFFGNPAFLKKLASISFLLAVFLILFFRNTRMFIYPEPWVEDMLIFLPHEYFIGFPKTAFMTYQGYIHLLPRMIAWISLKFGLQHAMVAMNWTVLFIKIMIFYLIYRSEEIRSPVIKFSLLAYLILVPFGDEIYNNVTNLQWWLIPLMMFIILRQESNRAAFLFDICLLVLCGLTGVNSILFVAPCAYLFYKLRTKQCLIKGEIMLACACIQIRCLAESVRVGGLSYDGGVVNLIHMFVNRVIYHTFFKFDYVGYLNLFVFCIYMLTVLFNLYYYRKNITVKFVVLFSAVFTASIFYAMMKEQFGPLENDIRGFGSDRYFVLLRAGSFVLLVSSLNILLRFLFGRKNYKKIMVYLCFLLCLALVKNYGIKDFYTFQYYDDIQKFESAEIGEKVRIHYAPEPPERYIDLTK